MYHNDIPDLEPISSNRFENVFKVNQTEEYGYHFYNLIKSVRFSEDLEMNEKYFFKYRVDRLLPYTALSYRFYETINLWWLICVVNNIDNPVQFVEPGTTLKIISKQHVGAVIDLIKKQL